MTQDDITSKLDTLLTASRTSSPIGDIVCTAGIITIGLAVIAMLPPWSETPMKKPDGSLNTYWCTKVVAYLITIVATIVLVRALMHSKENQEAAATDPDLTKQLPFIKELVG